MTYKQPAQDFAKNIVYIKEVAACDLPANLLAEVQNVDRMFAVHDADGTQLALVGNRKLAFHLARQNALMPVGVH